jgi:hypothetical protein
MAIIKKATLLLFTLLTSLLSLAQMPFVKTLPGCNCTHQPGDLIQTSTGEYLLNVNFDPQNLPMYRSYLHKLDISGNPIWSKQFTANPQANMGVGIQHISEAADGNYFVITPGEPCSYAPTTQCIYFNKLDTAGNFIWQTCYSNDSSIILQIYDAQATNDGGLLFICTKSCNGSNCESGIAIGKIKSNGSLEFLKTIDSLKYSLVNETANFNYNLLVVNSNVYIAGCDSVNPRLLKYNIMGDSIWCKSYPFNDSLGVIDAKRVREASDGSLFTLFERYSFLYIGGIRQLDTIAYTLIHTDSFGNLTSTSEKIWTLGMPLFRIEDFKLFDQDKILATTASPSCQSTYPNYYPSIYELTTLDTNLNIISSLCLGNYANINFVGKPRMNNGLNNSTLITALVDTFSTYSEIPFYACLDSSGIIPLGLPNNKEDEVNFKFFPNPAHSQITFSCKSNQKYLVAICSVSGGIIENWEIEQSQIKIISAFPQGLYVLKIFENNLLKEVKKLVIY